MEKSSGTSIYDHPCWHVYSTANSFTVTPITPFSVQKSLIIDKHTGKIGEYGKRHFSNIQLHLELTIKSESESQF